jgi:hypothetical protein
MLEAIEDDEPALRAAARANAEAAFAPEVVIERLVAVLERSSGT